MSPWLITVIVIGCVAFVAAVLCLLYYVALPKIIVHKIRNDPNPDGAMTYQPDYDALKEKTTAAVDLTYPSEFPAHRYNLYLPKDASAAHKVPLIVWIHGGGFIGGSKDGGENVMVSLCAAGYAVASIDYAVAPEYKYPTAVKQVAHFVKHLGEVFEKNPQIDPSRIVFGGDSAGAQIAAQYVALQTNAAAAKELQIEQASYRICAAVLVCGPFDLPAVRAYAKRTNGMFRRLVDIWGRAYYGKFLWYKSKQAQQTIVADHVTPDFPATFLTDGNKGSFEAQNRKLGETLCKNNVSVQELYFSPEDGDIPHEYLFHLDTPQAQQALAEILAFLHTSTRSPESI